MSTQTSVAAQSTLSGMTDKFGGKMPVRVFFLDNSSKMFLVKQGTNVESIIKMVLSKMEVPFPELSLPYYGLYVSEDGQSISHCLVMEESVTAAVESWEQGSPAKLLFMVRLFMPFVSGYETKDQVAIRLGKARQNITDGNWLDLTEISSEGVLNLQYLQAVYHVITGQFPCSPEDAISLGAYHFIFKFGEFEPIKHRPGFLGERIVEFIPTKLLKLKEVDAWEQLLFDSIRDIWSTHFSSRLESSRNPQDLYMRKVMSLSKYFGNSFFRASQTCTKIVPEKVIIGVSANGLNIYDRKRELLKSYKLEEIFRWGFKTNVLFYFEVRLPEQEDLTMLDFDSQEGQTIADLLTDYALIRVKELETLEVEGIDDVGEDESHPVTIAATSTRPFSDASAEDVEGAMSKASLNGPGSSGGGGKKPKAKASDLLALSQKIGSNPESLAAVVKIQAFARGVNARARVSEMIERMFETGELSVGGSDEEDLM